MVKGLWKEYPLYSLNLTVILLLTVRYLYMDNKEKAKLVFATNNIHKLEEIRRIIGDRWDILSLSDIGCHQDIPETADTLEGNALLKARFVKQKYGYDCFADDTGLMVDALNGEPGIYSGRYAAQYGGPDHDSEANIDILLKKLDEKREQGILNRNAHFSTVIALVMNNEEKIFEGSVDGVITESPSGYEGFGYDPVFLPSESDVTFAEMDQDAKNAISHRGRATAKLLEWLVSL